MNALFGAYVRMRDVGARVILYYPCHWNSLWSNTERFPAGFPAGSDRRDRSGNYYLSETAHAIRHGCARSALLIRDLLSVISHLANVPFCGVTVEGELSGLHVELSLTSDGTWTVNRVLDHERSLSRIACSTDYLCCECIESNCANLVDVYAR